MKLLLVTCLLVMCSFYVEAAAEVEQTEEEPEITKLELLDLGAGDSDDDADDSDVQRKRDSGYSYKRPSSFSTTSRARFQFGQSGHGGRIVNRHPAQINRPITKYGPPGYQNPPQSRPAHHSQQHRDKQPFRGHAGQQHSSNHDSRPNGYLEQEVPSPIRQVDFVEPNPISSQNNEPFASHAANYLPPQNQKLPGYTAPPTFSLTHAAQIFQNHNNDQANFQSQQLLQPQEQISDAALFLSQNSQAIQQLYGAPATEQDFAPNDSQFTGHNNQVQHANGQLQNFETSSLSPQTFAGPLPSYASGTLSAQETLEQIQSLEKDRLIVQLQRALATQTQEQAADAAGRYAQNQPSFVQNQDLLASLGQRTKIHGLNAQPSTVNVGSGNTAFNQSPFLPGTTISPGLPLNYGLLTTTTLPPTTTATTTTTTVQPPQAAKGDGSSQVGSTLQPAPSLPTPAAGLPVYGGFVPTLIAGSGFLSNVPSYGPSFFAPGTFTPVQTSGSSPTHFGLPIPTDLGQKPTTPSSTPSNPTTPSTSRPSSPSSPPIHAVPVPVHPVVAPLRPVTPLQPVIPATPAHVHPPQSSSVYPTYGIQSPVINPFLYKPIKPVYPLYYYPNVAYQLQKPASPTYPWSYAPTYATQAKPAQIWK
ncbi:ataxin-2 homolog [Hylaeus volcanicus]|uniref:ataxin-2 homolog n=1 Tax=Hylaeus volcanicus TaxID=313075 RepID=UPI0023B798F0|nr:ataxin-2 homolog [Hylaeus volcanicus]